MKTAGVAAVGTLRDLTDHELRQAAIRALAGWADQTGRRFHLYGNGWDKHDEFGRFAKGTVRHGPELGRAFRAATISLHTGCNSAAHQRVIDGLCAGGFMLIRDEPTQRLREMWQAIHACVREDRSLTAVMPDPTGYGRVIRYGDRVVGIVEESDVDEEQRSITEVAVSTYVFDGTALTEALGEAALELRGAGR